LEQREKLNKHRKQQKTSVLLGTPENWLGLARHDPSTRLEVYRSAILALTVRSIGEGSQLTVKKRQQRHTGLRQESRKE
jgi:hypothetical protein